MFYALAKGKIDTGPYRFTHELVDIETLNRRALEGELELTAVSVHAYAYLSDRYILCSCGASMGDRYGPMVVARRAMTLDELAGAHDCRAGAAHHGLSRPAALPGRRLRLRASCPSIRFSTPWRPGTMKGGASTPG